MSCRYQTDFFQARRRPPHPDEVERREIVIEGREGVEVNPDDNNNGGNSNNENVSGYDNVLFSMV